MARPIRKTSKEKRSFSFFPPFWPVYSREEGHFITQMGDVLVTPNPVE
jgi:hypothetical protein